VSDGHGEAIPSAQGDRRLVASFTGAPGVKGEASPEMVAAMSLPAFLRMAGKREIRPGGKHGWEWVMKLLAPLPGDRVLLVSTHWKRGRLPEGLRESGAAVVTLDSLPVGVLETSAFDAVVVEDDVAYLDAGARDALLLEVDRVLKPGGRLVLHELHWRQQPCKELLADMPGVWGRVPSPLTMAGWWDWLEAGGFSARRWHVGALPWFREKQVERDEGKERAAAFLAGASQPGPAGERLTRALKHADEFGRFYGWLAMSAAR
jgi:SAM-dependent methyltransferase